MTKPYNHSATLMVYGIDYIKINRYNTDANRRFAAHLGSSLERKRLADERVI